MAKTAAKALKKVSESRLGTAASTFLRCNCSMHAAGLTYFAMLALVPALCCVLVAAKAFGVDRLARDQINTRIDAMIVSVEKGQDDDLAKLAAPTCAPDESERKRIAAEEFASQARLISNSLFERIDRVYPGMFAHDKMVTAYDVRIGKPNPEPYLMGLQKAGVAANEAIVIENAPIGVQAGVAAGIFTVAVNTGPLKPESLLNEGANLLYPSMQALCDGWLELKSYFLKKLKK